MENWRKDSRKDIVMVDVDALVPKDHLLRKIEAVMDYEWLYARLSPYYCADNGRPGADPVVLIKMVMLQHLYGIPSLHQTHREIQVNIAYRWFLGYSLLEEISFHSPVLCFLKRFPPEISEDIFVYILNKALNHRMVDPSMISSFIDGPTSRHLQIKRSSRKNRQPRRQRCTGAACKEVAEERRNLGKKDKDDDENSGSCTEEVRLKNSIKNRS